jgi:hypothetical protein
MFIPVVLKAPRYYIYICTEETQRPLSATPIEIEDAFRITCIACSDVIYFVNRYLLFCSTSLVLLVRPTGCCKKKVKIKFTLYPAMITQKG